MTRDGMDRYLGPEDSVRSPQRRVGALEGCWAGIPEVIDDRKARKYVLDNVRSIQARIEKKKKRNLGQT